MTAILDTRGASFFLLPDNTIKSSSPIVPEQGRRMSGGMASPFTNVQFIAKPQLSPACLDLKERLCNIVTTAKRSTYQNRASDRTEEGSSQVSDWSVITSETLELEKTVEFVTDYTRGGLNPRLCTTAQTDQSLGSLCMRLCEHGGVHSDLEVFRFSDPLHSLSLINQQGEPVWGLRWKSDAQPVPASHKTPIILGELTGNTKLASELSENEQFYLSVPFSPRCVCQVTARTERVKSELENGEREEESRISVCDTKRVGTVHVAYNLSECGSLSSSAPDVTVGSLRVPSHYILDVTNECNELAFATHFEIPKICGRSNLKVNCCWHIVYACGWPRMVLTSIPGIRIGREEILAVDFGIDWFARVEAVARRRLFRELLTHRTGAAVEEFEKLTLSPAVLCKLCMQLESDGTNQSRMVICDGCHGCYHFGCLGLTALPVSLDQTWFCPTCLAVAEKVHSAGAPSTSVTDGEEVALSLVRIERSHVLKQPVEKGEHGLENNGALHNANKNETKHAKQTRERRLYLEACSQQSPIVKPCRICYKELSALYTVTEIGIVCRSERGHTANSYDRVSRDNAELVAALGRAWGKRRRKVESFPPKGSDEATLPLLHLRMNKTLLHHRPIHLPDRNILGSLTQSARADTRGATQNRTLHNDNNSEKEFNSTENEKLTIIEENDYQNIDRTRTGASSASLSLIPNKGIITGYDWNNGRVQVIYAMREEQEQDLLTMAKENIPMSDDGKSFRKATLPLQVVTQVLCLDLSLGLTDVQALLLPEHCGLEKFRFTDEWETWDDQLGGPESLLKNEEEWRGEEALDREEEDYHWEEDEEDMLFQGVEGLIEDEDGNVYESCARRRYPNGLGSMLRGPKRRGRPPKLCNVGGYAVHSAGTAYSGRTISGGDSEMGEEDRNSLNTGMMTNEQYNNVDRTDVEDLVDDEETGSVENPTGGDDLISRCDRIAKSLRPWASGIVWARTSSRWFATYKGREETPLGDDVLGPRDESNPAHRKRMKAFNCVKHGGVEEAYGKAVEFLRSVEVWDDGTKRKQTHSFLNQKSARPSDPDMRSNNKALMRADMDNQEYNDNMGVYGSRASSFEEYSDVYQRFPQEPGCYGMNRESGRSSLEGSGIMPNSQDNMGNEWDQWNYPRAYPVGWDNNKRPIGNMKRDSPMQQESNKFSNNKYKPASTARASNSANVIDYDSMVSTLQLPSGMRWYSGKKGFNVCVFGQTKWFSAPTRGLFEAYELGCKWIDERRREHVVFSNCQKSAKGAGFTKEGKKRKIDFSGNNNGDNNMMANKNINPTEFDAANEQRNQVNNPVPNKNFNENNNNMNNNMNNNNNNIPNNNNMQNNTVANLNNPTNNPQHSNTFNNINAANFNRNPQIQHPAMYQSQVPLVSSPRPIGSLQDNNMSSLPSNNPNQQFQNILANNAGGKIAANATSRHPCQ